MPMRQAAMPRKSGSGQKQRHIKARISNQTDACASTNCQTNIFSRLLLTQKTGNCEHAQVWAKLGKFQKHRWSHWTKNSNPTVFFKSANQYKIGSDIQKCCLATFAKIKKKYLVPGVEAGTVCPDISARLYWGRLCFSNCHYFQHLSQLAASNFFVKATCVIWYLQKKTGHDLRVRVQVVPLSVVK